MNSQNWDIQCFESLELHNSLKTCLFKHGTQSSYNLHYLIFVTSSKSSLDLDSRGQFDPSNCLLNTMDSFGVPTPKVGVHLGNERDASLHSQELQPTSCGSMSHLCCVLALLSNPSFILHQPQLHAQGCDIRCQLLCSNNQHRK